MYSPRLARSSFYRVWFLRQHLDTDRLSIYVEIGYAKDAKIDVETARAQVLKDLAKAGVITGPPPHCASTPVTMDPAYVHITQRSIAEYGLSRRSFVSVVSIPIGRYGGWTHCSIEDNIVEERASSSPRWRDALG